jgi:chaperonin GroES
MDLWFNSEKQMTNLKPVRDWLLVEPDKETQTASGIQLPEAYKEPGGTSSGHVVSFDEDYLRDDDEWMPVHADHIVFLRKHGIAVKHEGKNYLMVKDENVMAVIEES